MSTRTYNVDRVEQLAGIPRDTETLVLGQPRARQPAHGGAPPNLVLDGELLAQSIASLPRLCYIYASSVDLHTYILPAFPVVAPANILYLIQQAWRVDQHHVVHNTLGAERLVAIHAPRAVDGNSRPLAYVGTQVRVVRVAAVPITERVVERVQGAVGLAAFRETVVDVASSNLADVALVGCALGTVGRSVLDLGIRWGRPADMEHVEPERIARLLRLAYCPSLSSLALSVAFVAERPEAGRKQWATNMHLLASSIATALRQFELCVFVPEVDVLDQVKQVRWRALCDALARFSGLRAVTVVIKGPDQWLCDEVWQETERHLRGLSGRGVALTRGRFSKL